MVHEARREENRLARWNIEYRSCCPISLACNSRPGQEIVDVLTHVTYIVSSRLATNPTSIEKLWNSEVLLKNFLGNEMKRNHDFNLLS